MNGRWSTRWWPSNSTVASSFGNKRSAKVAFRKRITQMASVFDTRQRWRVALRHFFSSSKDRARRAGSGRPGAMASCSGPVQSQNVRIWLRAIAAAVWAQRDCGRRIRWTEFHGSLRSPYGRRAVVHRGRAAFRFRRQWLRMWPVAINCSSVDKTSSVRMIPATANCSGSCRDYARHLRHGDLG